MIIFYYSNNLNRHLKLHDENGAMNIHVISVVKLLGIYFLYNLISGICIRLVVKTEKDGKDTNTVLRVHSLAPLNYAPSQKEEGW